MRCSFPISKMDPTPPPVFSGECLGKSLTQTRLIPFRPRGWELFAPGEQDDITELSAQSFQPRTWCMLQRVHFLFPRVAPHSSKSEVKSSAYLPAQRRPHLNMPLVLGLPASTLAGGRGAQLPACRRWWWRRGITSTPILLTHSCAHLPALHRAYCRPRGHIPKSIRWEGWYQPPDQTFWESLRS